MKHAPVIIIGMHRSGTTLLAKLLKQAELWIGNDLIDTWESRFFLNRNEKILNAGGGSWASPECAEAILGHSSLRRALTLELKQDASSAFCAGYLGLKRYIKHRSLFNLQEPWGWKEPRTMLLLPLYLDIFPGAKVIHIVRNGVDVAASLARREQVRLEQTILKKSASEKLGALSREYNKEPSFFSLLHNYAISARLRYHPVEKYRKYGLLPIASLEKGFELWRYYLNIYFEHQRRLNFNALDVKYESFLESPVNILTQLIEFCELRNSKNTVKDICNVIDTTRKNAYKQDKDLVNFYHSVKSDIIMQKLYGQN